MNDETNTGSPRSPGVQYGKLYCGVPTGPEKSHYLKRSKQTHLGMSKIKLAPDN